MNARVIGVLIGAGIAGAVAFQLLRRQIGAPSPADARADDRVNEALDESFPASDPPSFTPVTGSTVN